jgi:DHA1 family multidrug resistance protein-like MFS transporter
MARTEKTGDDSSADFDAESGRLPNRNGEDEIELERINTYRLQQQETVGSSRSRIPREQWLPLGAGKPYPPDLPNVEAYIVEFEGPDDPMHPQNWPMTRR